MKKLFLAILFLNSLCGVCFSAISAGTVWEVRTTGNANNGGGFNPINATPGTDYSQQDAAQDSGDDLASTDGDASPCVVTSATHNFVDTDEGNLINITEAGTGFTLGYYEIVSTSANSATLDRACGSDGAITGGDWYLGGATNHPQTIVSNVIVGNVVHVKAGTYQKIGANTFVLQLINGSAFGDTIRWIGYNTTRGDNPTSTNRPILDGNSGSATNVIDMDNKHGNFIENFIIQNASSNNVINPGTSLFSNVKISGSGANGIGEANPNSGLVVINCEINNNSADGINGNLQKGNILLNNYIHDNTGDGYDTNRGDNAMTIVGNVFDTNANGAIDIGNDASSTLIANNVFFNHSTSGLVLGGNSPRSGGYIIYNNIFQGNTTYGIGGKANINAELINNNVFYGNGTNVVNASLGASDSTSDPAFTDATNGDFTIGSSSPALDLGIDIGDYTSITGDYKLNSGVDQDTNTTGTGSVTTGWGYAD